jgi:hypothetical protein
MDLNEKIDILIDAVYNQKIRNQNISNIFKSKGIDYDYDSSHNICEKVEELGIFRTINTSSSSGADLILYSNQNGLIFVDKFKTYSNFLYQQKIKEEFEQIKIKEKEQRELVAHEANLTASKAAVSSKKSSWTSSIIAAIATLFAIIQYFKSNEINEKYDKAIVQIDSLKQDLKEMKIHNQSLTDSSKIKTKKK